MEPVIKKVGRENGDVSKMAEKFSTISVKVEELWTQKMYQSRDTNDKAVVATEANKRMAALESKVKVMDDRVVTNTSDIEHVASIVEIKIADVHNQLAWSKSVSQQVQHPTQPPPLGGLERRQLESSARAAATLDLEVSAG